MAISDTLVAIGALEFYCAQVPYLMKGSVTGIIYGILGFFYDTFSSGITAFQNEVIGMGNWNIKLWILVVTDATDIIPGDSDGSYSCCDEVVQEKEERCTA